MPKRPFLQLCLTPTPTKQVVIIVLYGNGKPMNIAKVVQCQGKVSTAAISKMYNENRFAQPQV